MKYAYEVAGKKVELEQDPDVVAVRFKEPAPHSMRAAASRRGGLGPFENRYEVPAEKYTLLPVGPSAEPRPAGVEQAMDGLSGDDEVERTSAVFSVGSSHVFATDRVIVCFKDDPGDMPKQVAAVDGEIVARMENELVVRLPERSDPLALASQWANDEAVDYAEPDFITVGKHVAQRQEPSPQAPPPVRDPLSGGQYAIRITQAVEAWRIQAGDPSVTIAILDEGVDTGHEDLATAVVGAYDGVDDDTFQEPKPWDAHGTACAGLAAAIHNDRGVKGIGGGCSLMAIRIAYSPSQGARWTTWNSWIARAIEWAWRNGADVLSNSWGGGAPSNAVIRAFERARTRGRNGKGCVVIVAAGNESGPVSFPADLPNLFAVSASNEYDEFKTRTSRDGEDWWGSNFGPEIDIGAPGVHNRTTDITGVAGYSPTGYTDTFNGTSSATPIVAGCAGLLLSANPDLIEARVREILRETADKVGHTPYHAGRNDEMGHGRLNVLRAVQAATDHGTL